MHNRGFTVLLATQSPDEQAVTLIAETELGPLRSLSIGFVCFSCTSFINSYRKRNYTICQLNLTKTVGTAKQM